MQRPFAPLSPYLPYLSAQGLGFRVEGLGLTAPFCSSISLSSLSLSLSFFLVHSLARSLSHTHTCTHYLVQSHTHTQTHKHTHTRSLIHSISLIHSSTASLAPPPPQPETRIGTSGGGSRSRACAQAVHMGVRTSGAYRCACKQCIWGGRSRLCVRGV